MGRKMKSELDLELQQSYVQEQQEFWLTQLDNL